MTDGPSMSKPWAALNEFVGDFVEDWEFDDGECTAELSDAHRWLMECFAFDLLGNDDFIALFKKAMESDTLREKMAKYGEHANLSHLVNQRPFGPDLSHLYAINKAKS